MFNGSELGRFEDKGFRRGLLSFWIFVIPANRHIRVIQAVLVLLDPLIHFFLQPIPCMAPRFVLCARYSGITQIPHTFSSLNVKAH